MALSLIPNVSIFLAMVPSMVQQHLLPAVALISFQHAILNGALPFLPALLIIKRIILMIRLGRRQIFVSDSSQMMMASNLDVVMFDKSGTLTVNQVT